MPKENRNLKQDLEIIKLHTKFDAFKERFDKFIDNEFTHLKNNVDRIIFTIIIGFLISIVLLLIGIFLK